MRTLTEQMFCYMIILHKTQRSLGMRKIIFLQGEGKELPETVFQECSRYTPLVEPQEDGSVFCDLSGCGPAGRIIKAAVHTAYRNTGQPVKAAAASSRLLAETALKSGTLPPAGKKSAVYRFLTMTEGTVIEVLPGQEQAFLSSLPLKEFPGLTPSEIKKLTRTGFSKVGELADLSRGQLLSLLGDRAYVLYERCRGIDKRPVLGLYPPSVIIYPLIFESEEFNLCSALGQMNEAGQVLQDHLQKRYSGCTYIALELKTGSMTLRQERRFQDQIYRAERISSALAELAARFEFNEAPEEGRILLSEITPLIWKEQDLFSLLPCERQGTESIAERVLEGLEKRFPGRIHRGIELDRREQILAYFDPWRF